MMMMMAVHQDHRKARVFSPVHSHIVSFFDTFVYRGDGRPLCIIRRFIMRIIPAVCIGQRRGR
jgi:hypothetical protein